MDDEAEEKIKFSLLSPTLVKISSLKWEQVLVIPKTMNSGKNPFTKNILLWNTGLKRMY